MSHPLIFWLSTYNLWSCSGQCDRLYHSLMLISDQHTCGLMLDAVEAVVRVCQSSPGVYYTTRVIKVSFYQEEELCHPHLSILYCSSEVNLMVNWPCGHHLHVICSSDLTFHPFGNSLSSWGGYFTARLSQRGAFLHWNCDYFDLENKFLQFFFFFAFLIPGSFV